MITILYVTFVLLLAAWLRPFKNKLKKYKLRD